MPLWEINPFITPWMKRKRDDRNPFVTKNSRKKGLQKALAVA
jgi:hypothetical protein